MTKWPTMLRSMGYVVVLGGISHSWLPFLFINPMNPRSAYLCTMLGLIAIAVDDIRKSTAA
jgi:hypothetical protein